jgi:transcriptional regulator with XRE-family HTH domain
MSNLTFGQKLLILRKNKKLSQKQLSDTLHIAFASLARYENDQRLPSAEILIKLSDFFNVSVDYLIKNLDQDFVSIENKQILSLAHKIDKLAPEDQSFLVDMIQNYLNKFERNNGKM